MSKTRWTFLILLAVLAAAFFFWRNSQSPSMAEAGKGTGQRDSAVPVIVTRVNREEMPVWLTGIGTVQASSTVTVRPRVGGALESVSFTEGAVVQAGDVLAQIDPRPYRSALAQAQAKKAQNEAQLANAATALERSRSLARDNAVSRQVLDQSEASAAQLQALVQADQAAVEAAQLDLDFTTLRAPISGKTGVRLVDAGNLVTANQAEGIVVVTQLQPVNVVFTLPQRYLQQLGPHMKPGASQPETQAMDDAGRLLGQGKLELVDNQIDASTGTLRLKAVFPNADYALWPGQFVTAKVLVDTLKDVLAVPSEAVQAGLDGPFVYLVKEDGTVEARPVKTGMVLAGRTQIAEGLQLDDRVVREGQNKLKPGSKISEKKADA